MLGLLALGKGEGMRHRIRVALMTAVLICVSLASVGETTHLVGWTETLELSWGWFLATPPSNASPSDVASIFMDLKWTAPYEVKRNGSSWIGYTTAAIVSNTMNPKLSWVRRSAVTPAALRHEAYLFRLNEVYRRKAEAALLAVSVTGRTAEETKALLHQRIQEVADAYLAKADAMAYSCEAETNSGSNLAAQATWEQKIDAWLIDPSLAP